MSKDIWLRKNDPIKKTLDFHGIDVDVEWPAGSIRQYKDSDFRKKMIVNYGYIRNTDSVDGEEIDVYFDDTDYESCKKVYKITQLMDPAEGKDGKPWSFDEYKYMLGFKSKSSAINTYIKSMTSKHYGGIKSMSVNSFKGVISKNQKRIGVRKDEESKG